MGFSLRTLVNGSGQRREVFNGALPCKFQRRFPHYPTEAIQGEAAWVGTSVDWDSIKDDRVLNFLDNLSCHRLNLALRGICQDDMGKEAVRDGLKLVRLKNVKTTGGLRLGGLGDVQRLGDPGAADQESLKWRGRRLAARALQ